MRIRTIRVLLVGAIGLSLAACSTSKNIFGQNGSTTPKAADAFDSAALPPTAPSASNGNMPPALGAAAAEQGSLLGSNQYDDLNRGKKQFLAQNYGLAEQHFRRAVEQHPNDAQAWLGLAASYDRLRRFDLADRAYTQAIRIAGPTVEILNNEGYSYMLRGDYKHARAKLLAAQKKDPGNKYVLNNLRLLQESYHQGKAVE
jgi:Tfp pilus assembly protein PilF